MDEPAGSGAGDASRSGRSVQGRETLRNLATLGLAVGAPLTLLSGLFIGVTLITGPPAFLWGVFLASAATSVLSLLVYAYLASDLRR